MSENTSNKSAIFVISAIIILTIAGYWLMNQGISNEELFENSKTCLNTIQINGLRVGGDGADITQDEVGKKIYLNI